MKYTARGESRVANIARGKAECYICHQELYILYKRSSSALGILLYFTLNKIHLLISITKNSYTLKPITLPTIIKHMRC